MSSYYIHSFCSLLLLSSNDYSDISANEKQSSKNENANNGSNEFAIEHSNPNGNESRSDPRARYEPIKFLFLGIKLHDYMFYVFIIHTLFIIILKQWQESHHYWVASPELWVTSEREIHVQ